MKDYAKEQERKKALEVLEIAKKQNKPRHIFNKKNKMQKIEKSPRSRVKLTPDEIHKLKNHLENEAPIGGYKEIFNFSRVTYRTVKRVLERGWGEKQTVDKLKAFIKEI